MTAFEYVMSNGGAAYNGAGSAQQQEQHQPAQQQEQPQQQPPPAVLSASISNASSEVGARNSPIIKMPPRVAAKQQLRCASMLHALKAKHSGGQSHACASRAAVPAYRYPVHFFYPPPPVPRSIACCSLPFPVRVQLDGDRVMQDALGDKRSEVRVLIRI